MTRRGAVLVAVAVAAVATGVMVMQSAPIIEGVRRNRERTIERVMAQTETLLLIRPVGENQGRPVGVVTVALSMLCQRDSQ